MDPRPQAANTESTVVMTVVTRKLAGDGSDIVIAHTTSIRPWHRIAHQPRGPFHNTL